MSEPNGEMATSAPPRTRMLALDVFRGLTVASMLLVNTPGSWSAIYPPLEHAEWHGWTPTDLIFPFFLFIVGVTTHLAMRHGSSDAEKVRRALRRGGIIILLGLILNAFPFYTWGTVPGIDDPTLAQRIAHRFTHMRFPGVLQRIGICFILGSLLTLRTTRRQQIAIIVSLLLGYWILVCFIPIPPHGLLGVTVLDRPDQLLPAWADRTVFGNHLWVQTKTWDPEGLLSTIPAVATTMLGILCGALLSSPKTIEERLANLFAYGSLGAVAGLVWNWWFPINKNLWTSSYVVFTAGLACLTLGCCIWLTDVRKSRWWTPPLLAFGVNPILAFAGSGLMARFLYSLIKVEFEGRRVAIAVPIYQRLFASWLDPRNASLAFAITFVLLWLAILWPLYRKNVIIKI